MINTVYIPADPTQPDKRWKPRPHQRAFWHAVEKDTKRINVVWHRRSGKDECALHALVVRAHQRVGTYWYMLPEKEQVRKAIWRAIDEERGMRRIDLAIPPILRANTREDEMFIPLKVGSTIQFLGSDNYNSVVGSPPVGVVFSEWPLADPLAWGYISPILEKNGGWAIFNGTPRGPNHGKRLFEMAITEEGWFGEILTAKQTDVFDDMALERIRKDSVKLHSEALGNALFEQEYMCSFEAAILGAVYGNEIATARAEGRICEVPYDRAYPVETWWDIGFRDPTAIWFIQRMPGGVIHAIDYYENSLIGLDHYVQVLNEKGYAYSRHLMPHDAEQGAAGSGLTIKEQAAQLGLRVDVIPVAPLIPQINKCRPVVARTKFDIKKCQHGLDALTNYAYGWDERKRSLTPKPLHNWASHGADAFRTGAAGKEPAQRISRPLRKKLKVA